MPSCAVTNRSAVGPSNETDWPGETCHWSRLLSGPSLSPALASAALAPSYKYKYGPVGLVFKADCYSTCHLHSPAAP